MWINVDLIVDLSSQCGSNMVLICSTMVLT